MSVVNRSNPIVDCGAWTRDQWNGRPRADSSRHKLVLIVFYRCSRTVVGSIFGRARGGPHTRRLNKREYGCICTVKWDSIVQFDLARRSARLPKIRSVFPARARRLDAPISRKKCRAVIVLWTVLFRYFFFFFFSLASSSRTTPKYLVRTAD